MCDKSEQDEIIIFDPLKAKKPNVLLKIIKKLDIAKEPSKAF